MIETANSYAILISRTIIIYFTAHQRWNEVLALDLRSLHHQFAHHVTKPKCFWKIVVVFFSEFIIEMSF